MRTISCHNQKTDTTAQLYCTLSTYVTQKTISHQNQKTNTTQQLYCTLSTEVCKPKTYFPPESKTVITAQLEKKILQPTCSNCGVKECLWEWMVIFLSVCVKGILQLFTNFYLQRKLLIFLRNYHDCKVVDPYNCLP